MRSRTSLKALVAVAATASLLLAGCSSSSDDDASAPSASGPVPGGKVVDLQNFAAGDPDNIDPALAADTQSSQIAELLFDGLTESTVDGQVRNAVAESVSSSADRSVWTFKLRSDVRFDNNDLVRPSDFKFAWDRAADPKLASNVAYQLAPIQGFGDVATGVATTLSGVVADDKANTLTVTLSAPKQDFDAIVSLPVFSPIPKAAFDAAAGGTSSTMYSRWEDGVMIGNGPFRMANPWEKGRAITLARSDSYYGGSSNHKAYVDSVEFRISKSVDSAYTDFENGTGQVGRIPAGRFGDVSKSRGDDVVNTPLLGTEYWAFNMKSPTVGGPDNVKLRQAIALATDKKDLNDKVYGGSRSVATALVPPAMPGYDATNAQPDRNVERARQLLREWGKTLPTLKISFNAGAGHEEKASILAQNLADIGITATPDPLENAAYRTAVRSGSLDMFRFNWTADYVSYDNFIAPSFTTAGIGRDNNTNYSDTTVDGLVKQAQGESDASNRYKLYRQAEKKILDDQVIIPLDWTAAGLIKAPAVHDLKVKPLGYVNYADTWLSR